MVEHSASRRSLSASPVPCSASSSARSRTSPPASLTPSRGRHRAHDHGLRPEAFQHQAELGELVRPRRHPVGRVLVELHHLGGSGAAAAPPPPSPTAAFDALIDDALMRRVLVDDDDPVPGLGDDIGRMELGPGRAERVRPGPRRGVVGRRSGGGEVVRLRLQRRLESGEAASARWPVTGAPAPGRNLPSVWAATVEDARCPGRRQRVLERAHQSARGPAPRHGTGPPSWPGAR